MILIGITYEGRICFGWAGPPLQVTGNGGGGGEGVLITRRRTLGAPENLYSGFATISGDARLLQKVLEVLSRACPISIGRH